MAAVLALPSISELDEGEVPEDAAVLFCISRLSDSRTFAGGAGDDGREPRLRGTKDRTSSSFSEAVLSCARSSIVVFAVRFLDIAADRSRFALSKLKDAQSAVRSKNCVTLGSRVIICMKLCVSIDQSK